MISIPAGVPNAEVSMDDVFNAVVLLQSIGVKHLCHDTEASWEPALLPMCGDHEHYQDDEEQDYDQGVRALFEPGREFASLQEKETFYAVNILGVIVCVGFVALIAGLFLGMLTLDVLDLRIIERASIDEDEKMYAATLLPIIENRHQLLVTLLLLNALAYETLPIFLDNLVPTWVAILLSTTLVMWFGEILPSGIFTGPHQLYLGSRMAPLTRFFLWIMYPFAKPLAMVLDHLVKEEDGTAPDSGAEYNRGELSALVRIQYEDSTTGKLVKKHPRPTRPGREDSWHAIKQEIIEKANERFDLVEYDEYEGDEAPVEQLAPPLHKTEVDLIEGALQMKTVLVMDVFTPLSKVYAISDDMVLDRNGLTGIYQQGYSRVPVFRKQPNDPDNDEKIHILGFLMVRQLILIDWDHEREVSTLPLQRPSCVSPRMNLVDGMRILRSRGYLMAFVCARPDLGNKALAAEKPIPVEAGFMGIVTLEDIMESLLQQRIYDEWDIRDRDRAVATLQKWAATKLQSFIKKSTEKIKMQRRHSNGSVNNSHSLNESTPLLNTSNSSLGHYA